MFKQSATAAQSHGKQAIFPVIGTAVAFVTMMSISFLGAANAAMAMVA